MKGIDAHIAENMLRQTDICEHLLTLYQYAHVCKSVLELGVRGGESTIALLYAMRENGGHLTSIDADNCFNARVRVDTAGLLPHWTMIQGDDMAVPWEKHVGMMFVDTSHTYAHTLAELKKFEPLVERYILMHDTVSHPPVRQAIGEYFTGRENVKIGFTDSCNGLAVISKNK